MLPSRRTTPTLLLVAPLSCALALFGAPLSALAQPNSAASSGETSKELARTLADRGFDLYQAGKYDEALAHFQGADRTFHAPTLVLMIARIHERRGKLADAEARYQQVIAEGVAVNAPVEYRRARARALAELAAIKSRIPKLVLRLDDPSAVARVKLTVDGRSIPTSRLRHPLSVNPGEHTVEVVVVGFAPTVHKLTFAEGHIERIELANLSRHRAPEVAGDEQPTDLLVPSLLAFGVGAAGLLAGAIAGVIALNRKSELERRCPTKVCSPEDEELADAVRASATASTVGLIVGGLGVGVGLTLLLLHDGSATAQDAASVQIRLAPTGAKLEGRF